MGAIADYSYVHFWWHFARGFADLVSPRPSSRCRFPSFLRIANCFQCVATLGNLAVLSEPL